MAEIEAPKNASLKALQSRQDSFRRARPPDIDAMKRDENRVPLRGDRMAKRESKLNLRGLFSRPKPTKTVRATESTTSLRELSRAGKRISLAEISNWPYVSQTPRSEVSLPSPVSTSSSSSPASSRRLQQSRGLPGNAELESHPVVRGSAAIPLFQAYPQAIKHGTLPCCTTPMESLHRLNAIKSGLTGKAEPMQSSSTLASVEEATPERKPEGPKRRTRGVLEWRSKIYVLVTSGYLLQYAAEGAFNRLPEKVLQLTKDSAVFASDLLPGRHWVLQVASSVDAEGNSTLETKSRISKLAFRNNVRRQTASFLLVFESAEAMDSWLATLRKEIQSLGGKKKLSETGKIDAEDDGTESKQRLNRRTLVVRDPERFSRIFPPNLSLTPESSIGNATDIEPAGPVSDQVSGSVPDDVSVRASTISSDGQQLDSLRNSSHRLSYVSSGQRTFFTSPESSPTCSPTRPSFSSGRDDSVHEYQSSLPVVPEVRPRPNATAILNRRQSMQTVIAGLDSGYVPNLRPQTSLSTISDASNQGVEYSPIPSSSPIVPNFSVPQGSSRRFSTTVSAQRETASPPRDSVPDKEIYSRSLRRSPPPMLGVSRPLSIVLDQSPISPLASNGFAKFPSPTRERFPGSSHSTMAPPRIPATSKPAIRQNVQSPPTRIGLLSPKTQNGSSSPRKYSSTGNLRDNRRHVSSSQVEKSTAALSQATTQSRVATQNVPDVQQRITPRAASSMGDYGSSRNVPAATGPKARNKRASFVGDKPSFQYSLNSYGGSSVYDTPLIEEPTDTVPQKTPENYRVPSTRFSRISPPRQQLAVAPHTKTLLTSRSMPHLEGPPPLPPPNRALPAIPKKSRPESSARILKV